MGDYVEHSSRRSFVPRDAPLRAISFKPLSLFFIDGFLSMLFSKAVAENLHRFHLFGQHAIFGLSGLAVGLIVSICH